MSHCRSLNWVKAVDCRHNEKRLLYALSWRSETSQLSISVKDGATVDGLCGYVISSFAGVREHFSRCMHNLREASVSLLVQQRWAMRRPQNVERATVRLSRFFVYLPIANEECPEVYE